MFISKKERKKTMAIGIGFANDEYNEKSIEDYYEEELSDAPIGAGGFVRDICYEKAIEQYFENKKR
jgi:hypothetical protein